MIWNKRGIAKAGIIFLLILSVGIIIFSAFINADFKKNYEVGEKIKLDLSEFEDYQLVLKSPSRTDSYESGVDFFIIQFKEEGEYYIFVESGTKNQEWSFIVNRNSEEQIQETKEITIEEEDGEEKNYEEDIKNESIEEKPNQPPRISVGEPVLWKEEFELDSKSNLRIKIPESSEEIKVTDENSNNLNLEIKKTISDSVSDIVEEGKQKSVIIKDVEGKIEITYKTPGPDKEEEEISETQKNVKVYSEEGLHYTNVFASTNLSENILLENKDSIKVYWKEENTYLDFEVKDENQNGFIDKIEWMIPHLSEQNFEITIKIDEAQHLNSNREFISDIYDSVRKLDDIWSETINSDEYVKIKFEKNLTKENDITIYPRIVGGNPRIEVYENNENNLIAEFTSLNSNEYNKVYLTNLENEQDTFDLKILDGSVEFDYLVDPFATYNTTIGAPRCLDSVSPCIANSTLLQCAGAQSSPGPEPNRPNTIDTCADATTIGTCHSDESVENITIIDVNRSLFTQGDTITVTTTWYCYGTADRIAIYYTNSTSAIIWQNKLVGTTTCPAAGYYTRNTTFKLDNVSGQHAVRAIMLYNANIGSACPTGNYRDQDDLAFQVSALVSDNSPTVNLSYPYNNYVNDTTQYVNINFNASVSDDKNLVNCSLWTNYSGVWSLNQTQTITGTTNVTNMNINSLTNKSFIWNIRCYDNSSQSSWGSSNRTVKLNWTAPPGSITVDLINPVSNKNVNQNQFFNFTARVNCVGGMCGNVNATLDPASAWWDSDWRHRTQINISEKSNNNLLGYTMNISLDTLSLVSSGKMNSDLGDLRIIVNGTESAYQIEPYTNNTSNTIINFKIDLNSSQNRSDIFVYYGNPEASSPSYNLNDVYMFFDDFNRANKADLTTGDNYTGAGNALWNITNNVLITRGGTSDPNKLMITPLGSTPYNNGTVVVKMKITTWSNGDLDRFGPSMRMDGNGGAGRGYGSLFHNSQNNLDLLNDQAAWTRTGSYSWSTNTWYYHKFMVIGDVAYQKVWLANSVEPSSWTLSPITMTGTPLRNSGYYGLASSNTATDVAEYDDLKVYKSTNNPPTVNFGNEENSTKGIVPMNTGTPFYTTTQNPRSSSVTSCLSNMGSGDSCNVTWIINATGIEGSTWEFFVYANSTSYSGLGGQSSSVNITIGNLPPTVPELNSPANESSISIVGELNWSNSADPTGDPVYYILEVSNNSNFSNFVYRNSSIAQQTEPTGDTPTGITNEGEYYWRVRATDLIDNSSWSETRVFYYDLSAPKINLTFPINNTLNSTSNNVVFKYTASDVSQILNCSLIINGEENSSSTNITKNIDEEFSVFLPNGVYTWGIKCVDKLGRINFSETRTITLSVSNNAPVAREIECEENSNWKNCGEIEFSENITRMRVKCTDPENGVVNATFNLTNIPDNSNYLFETTTDNSGDYWILDNSDLMINDSGEFEILATCFDDESLSGTNSTTWNVNWGSITINLVDPSSDSNVMKNAFFNFTAMVNCVGGECGNINSTLDPDNWWNSSWEKRKRITIANNNPSTVLQKDYSINIVVNTSGDDFLSNGDDVRIIYYNGMNNVELDRINFSSSNSNVSSFNSPFTSIWFKLQNNISAGDNDSNYYVYYRNPSAGSPPKNQSNVWYFYDDFSTNKGWTTAGGSWSVNGDYFNQTSSSSTTTEIGALAPSPSPSRSYEVTARIKARIGVPARIGIITEGRTDVTYGVVGLRYIMQDGTGDSAHWGILNDHTAWIQSDIRSSTANVWWTVTGKVNSTGVAIKMWNETESEPSSYSYTEEYAGARQGTYYGISSWQYTGSANYPSSTDWFRMRLILDSEPSTSLNSTETRSKGIISTTTGETPFYTTTQNPINSSTANCLYDMKSGDSCELTWNVNATGSLNSIWEFFVYANNEKYTEIINLSGESAKINLKIVNQLAPSVPQLFYPANSTAFSTIQKLSWNNSVDVNGDSVYYILEVSNNSNFSNFVYRNSSIAQQTEPTEDTPTGITNEGKYYWRVRATDLIDNSSWSGTRVFYYDLSAPNLTFLNQTGEDGLKINSTNPLDQGERTRFFVNVNDTLVDKVWIVIWEGVVGGVKKIKTFFTYAGGILWFADVSTENLWNTIYNYTIYSNDTLGNQVSYNGNFSVLTGNLTIYLSPSVVNEITNVSVYGKINFSDGTDLENHPINVWLDGNLIMFSNLTPEGTYNNYQSFLDNSYEEFSKGETNNLQINSNNVTLSDGEYLGNLTRILDAGAIVEWNSISWNFTGESCSGNTSYQEGDSNNYSGTHDSYIDSSLPSTNYGNSDIIIIDGSPNIERGVIKFENIIGREFNQIPENATITNANLTLTVSDLGNQVDVYEILENWNENEVTYNNRLTESLWSSSGIGNYPSRSLTAIDSFTASSTGKYTLDITNSVKKWVNESLENNGFVMDMATSNGINIVSSESPTQSDRPLMNVEYIANECTNVVVYVRTSYDKTNWSSWRQIENGSTLSQENIGRYLEYKLELTSVNTEARPTVSEVIVDYTATVTDSNGNYKYNFTNPSQFGTHEVKVNTSLRTINIESSKNLSVQTGVAPMIELISPVNGSGFSDGDVVLIYNTSDLNNDFVEAVLILKGILNETNSSRIINNNYNNFTINLSNGFYNWNVNITDSSGFVSTGAERNFYIDLENPYISLVYPSDGDTYTLNELNLSFIANDNFDDILTCNLTLDGFEILTGIYANNNSIKNVSSGILTSGLHNWNITCTDNVSRSYTSETFSFNISDTPPSVNLVSPSEGNIENMGGVSFNYNVSDNTGLINCSLILNESYKIWNQSEILNNQNNSINVFGLAEGNYNWTVECFDLSESSYKPASRNFSVDLNSPNVNLNLPYNEFISNSKNVNFNFTATDFIDEALVCNLTVGGQIVNYNINTNSEALTNVLAVNLTDGIKQWNVACRDDAGHTNTSETRTITIAEYPNVSLYTANNSAYTESSVNLTYFVSDNTGLSSCGLYLNDILNQLNSSLILNNAQNNFSVSGLTDGVYEWFVNCTDSFGLISQSEKKIFSIDSNPPEIILYNPNGENLFMTNITFNFSVIDSVDSLLNCNLSVDTIVRGNNFSVNNGSISNITISGISDGFHEWEMKCWDGAGNFNSSQIFNFTRYTNPEVTLTSPEDGHWFNSSSFELVYLPEDDEGIISSILVINGINNRTNSTPIENVAYNNFSITGFADGAYNWTVNVTDPTGLTAQDEERTFYVDTKKPELLLNAPNGSSVISTNNVTLNFTLSDNLDSNILCRLDLDGEMEYYENYSNGSQIIKQIIVSDGNHSWNVSCEDNAGNLNSSQIFNFVVEAPPFLTLDSPPTGNRTGISSANFVYTPYDLIGFSSCNLYIDGVVNKTESIILENQQNNFSLTNVPEGIYNWTVECFDSDSNNYSPNESVIYFDYTPPEINLNSPENNSGIDANQETLYFNWTAVDELDNFIECNLLVDGQIRKTGIYVTSNISKRESLSGVSLGWHNWSVRCWDRVVNTNESQKRNFNYTFPDFYVGNILFDNTEPKEDESIKINATVKNLEGADSNNVELRFYVGDPESGGTQIGLSKIINLSKFEEKNLSIDWNADMGSSEIYAVVDFPASTNGSFTETNEYNNENSSVISVGSWEIFNGNILSSSEYELAEQNNLKVISWETDNFQSGNIYVTDYDSTVSWVSLKSVGKTKTDSNSSDDFQEIDSEFEMQNFQDSVYNIFTNSGIPKKTKSIIAFNQIIYSVPTINSTNNTNFETGILWDYSDDIGNDGEFDSSDDEDLIFVSEINKQAPGTYGIYDYEIKIPAKLREYKNPDSAKVVFYVELN